MMNDSPDSHSSAGTRQPPNTVRLHGIQAECLGYFVGQTEGRLVVCQSKQHQIFLTIADVETDESTAEKFLFKMFISFNKATEKNSDTNSFHEVCGQSGILALR